MGLTDEVAIVTGSTRGIGAAIAEKLGREGAKVTVTGRSEDYGNAVLSTIRDNGGDAIFVRTDVTHEEEIQAAIAATVAAFGRLTVLVNNAAPTELTVGPEAIDGRVEHLTNQGWDVLFTACLKSAFWGCKHAIPEIAKAGGGSIVNIGSTAAIRGVDGQGIYSAAKAAMHALTRSIAVENADSYIRCNCILPGWVPNLERGDSRVDRGALVQDPEFGAAMRSFQPWPRWGYPDDVANVVAFFASREAEFVTGTVLPVDGGAMCRMPIPKMTREYFDEFEDPA